MTGRARRSDKSRHRAGPTTWARAAAKLADFAVSRGADRQALLSAAGLSEPELRNPDARVALEAFYSLAEEAAESTRDPLLGLHFALRLEVGDFDALGFLAMTSPTLGSALELMVRYQRLRNDGERYELSSGESVTRLRFVPYGPPRPAHGLFAVAAMADLVVNGGRLAGIELRPRRLQFACARPSEGEELEQAFGCPIEFSAPVTEVTLATEVLATPLTAANQVLSRFFAQKVHLLVEQLPSGPRLSDRVRSLLIEQPSADAGVVAKRLHMSSRTLQRGLSEEGVSLRALQEETRSLRATELLRAGMAIAEVSWLLGYSEPAAFHRAFRRWTGLTPEVWRQRYADST